MKNFELYDISKYHVLNYPWWQFWKKPEKTFLEEIKGLYSYEKDIFLVPKKLLLALQKGRPKDWDIISAVGYKIV